MHAHVYTLKRSSESNAFVALLRDAMNMVDDDERSRCRIIRERKTTFIICDCKCAEVIDAHLSTSSHTIVGHEQIQLVTNN